MRTKIGATWLTELSTPASAVSSMPATAGVIYALHLVLDGCSIDRQWGRECRLEAGDFAVYASGPHESLQVTRRLVLGIPSDTLRHYLPCPERVVALPMSGNTGVSGLVSSLLRDFWRRCREQVDAVNDPRVMHGILQLVGAAYANVPQVTAGPSQSAAFHKGQIFAYIEAHLGEGDLSPTHIASALRMTPRNLHYLFASEGETVARYILRRRLEESVRALTCVPPQQRTLTEIALELGFGSVTHFGRAFRRCYGMTPSEYRLGGAFGTVAR